MSGLKRLIHEIHRRSLWQVLGIYLGASFAVLEAVDLLIERLGLPGWFFPSAFVLLVIGLPIIMVTALVQSTDKARTKALATDTGEPSTYVAPAPPTADGAKRWFTWRNAIAGGVLALAFWGVSATVWLLIVVRAPRDASAATGLDPARIAVLYFEDFSKGHELGYLADGFTEALIHELSQLEALTVVSRNGAKPFRDSALSIDSIAHVLGAGSLVEGSLEQLGDRLRVTVQLIDGAKGTHLLSRRIEREGHDLLLLREDIVEEAAWLLRKRLGEEIRLRDRWAETESVEAWQLVQRAEKLMKDADALWDVGDTVSASRALADADSLLGLAEREDPEWVEPIILRGWVVAKLAWQKAVNYGEYDMQWTGVALKHAERALNLNPTYPRSLELRGTLRSYAWEIGASTETETDSIREAAEADLRAASRADPTRAVAFSQLSRIFNNTGRFLEARLAAEKAYEADEFLAAAEVILFRLCQTSLDLEDFEGVTRWCGEGQSRFPGFAGFLEPQLLLMASSVGPEPDADKGWILFKTWHGLTPPQRRKATRPVGLMYVAAILARAGLRDSALAVIRQARDADTLRLGDIDYYEANVRLQLGQSEEAIRLLESYLDAKPTDRAYIARDWWWRDLRDHLRFQALLEREQ